MMAIVVPISGAFGDGSQVSRWAGLTDSRARKRVRKEAESQLDGYEDLPPDARSLDATPLEGYLLDAGNGS